MPGVTQFQPGGQFSEIGIALIEGTATVTIEPQAFAVELRVTLSVPTQKCVMVDEDNNPMSFYTYTEACDHIAYLVNELM